MYTFPKPVGTGLIAILCRIPALGFVVAVGLLISVSWMGTNVPLECQPDTLVAFSFDDNYESTFEIGFPILKRYDYTATVYVITDMIGEPGRMNLDQLKELYNEGWEIASHSVSHPHLVELNANELERELQDSKLFLESQGFQVESFALPYGEYNDYVIAEIKRFYASNRTVDEGLNDFPLTEEERYRLKAIELNQDRPVGEIKAWIDRALEEKKRLILVVPQLDGEGYWNYSSQDFQAIVDYIYSLEFKPLNVERTNPKSKGDREIIISQQTLAP